jgi:hypothetical protein|tara:strand:- start:450 stop:641 length:192 start_codon:yes stop_codon:yes gene_type:complete
MAKEDQITKALKMLFDTSNLKVTKKVEKEIQDLVKKKLGKKSGAKKSGMAKGGLPKKKTVKKK